MRLVILCVCVYVCVCVSVTVLINSYIPAMVYIHVQSEVIYMQFLVGFYRFVLCGLR